MSPRQAWRAIQEAMPEEAIISSDIGNNCAIGNAYPTFEKSRKYFVSTIVTILHAFNYGSIDLILVTVLICGSILGVQVGQKIGETVDSSQFKTILALLLLLVGIAMVRLLKQGIGEEI